MTQILRINDWDTITEDRESEVLSINCKCRLCQNEIIVHPRRDEWENYKNGQLAQVALKSLSADDREILISSICGKCFDHITGF